MVVTGETCQFEIGDVVEVGGFGPLEIVGGGGGFAIVCDEDGETFALTLYALTEALGLEF